ncbi:transposase domain-containing protein [Roseospira visakhapatnamensis]|uniref:HTH Mu-type domain-containing protein n=1 Tax=Roseospira visakhapatnamensis TaxID=390880 RepID=A0A7W6WBQ7_9PROT|nr:transposase domain-containing protein [Roseospira visakhapatnamensis]MBB4267797.1 hypothetical protein [Roseospira visakhapatnamensis]
MTDWLTAAEIADLRLPGMPRTREATTRRARDWQVPDRRWSNNRAEGVWRRRAGRGGGVEYHYSVLPPRARAAFLRRRGLAAPAAEAPPETPRAANDQADWKEAWARFEALPETRKDKARERLNLFRQVADLVAGGMSKTAAVELACRPAGMSPRTYYGLERRTWNTPREHWLPMLVDQRSGRVTTTDIPPDALQFLKDDYLRPEQPALDACITRLRDVAAERDWDLPSDRTLQRRLAEVDPLVVTWCREGPEAVARKFPAQRRDRTAFKALEAVNFDGHKFDVFVEWADGTIGRPMMAMFQDLYSGKVLSWRVDRSENAAAFRLAFGDVCDEDGIPGHIWLDNTRAASSKWLTGGVSTRFRFKIKDDDPVGLFKQLGCEVHFTTPYHGQSKPIERAFKDIAELVSKGPDCAGAYTGRSPQHKPHNYGSRAVPIDDFITIVDRELRRHNARPGRKATACRGRSFNQTFQESYESPDNVIRRATPEMRRLWLLAAEGVTCRTPTGEIHLMGNRYWDPALARLIGRKVVVRFDPDKLRQPIHVSLLDGSAVCEAACIDDTGFADQAAAKDHAAERRRFSRAVREMSEAEKRLTAAQVAAALPTPADAPDPDAKVIRIVGNTARRVAPEADEDAQAATGADFDRAFAAGVARLADYRASHE